MNIDYEPAFAWWLTYVHKKREIILFKEKYKYRQRINKYGIMLLNLVKENFALDE